MGIFKDLKDMWNEDGYDPGTRETVPIVIGFMVVNLIMLLIVIIMILVK